MWHRAIRALSWPCARAGPACRTRAASSSRPRSPRPTSTARDARWLDLCAGPGGKAALLGALAAQRGARLVANEVSEHRVELVRQSVAAAGDAVEVRWATAARSDATSPRRTTGSWSTCRAPGSGRCGAGPRRAGGASRVTSARSAGCSASCSARRIDATRPGGLVAYVTCSPHVGETLLVVQDALRRRDDVEQIDARPILAGVVVPGGESLEGTLGDGPGAQLWPHRHGTDAMFLALLRRR